MNMFATKNIIVKLNKDFKLTSGNYKIWSKCIHMVLVELKLFNHIKKIMKRLSSRLMNQHKAFLDE